ncbi:MAG TPA: ABC transporter ATP-binding protein, partial [Polyangiaceae bacterium]|nr:ABC transporter ATP-binding protein [Polyangiaceae bacterium]
MTEPLLCVGALTKHFPITRGVFSRVVGHVRAVDDVSFDIAPGETLGLVGESGSGKTTVGRCVLGLTTPTSGRVLFDGRDVNALPPRDSKRLRRDLQVVFQDPFSSLNPRMRVLDIVGEALEVHGLAKGPDVERRVAVLLERVGLSPSWIHRYPHEFSGGQRQRIGIARAIALEPKLIVCDEAVSALDVSIQAQVVNLLLELRREMGMAYLFIAHDLSVVRHLSHRIAAMYLGRIVEVAPSARLFAAPAHPYTRALLAAIPSLKPGAPLKRLVLSGEIPSPANPPSGCRFHTRCPAVRPECRGDEPRAVEVEPGHTVRCIHAYELPASGAWLEELSRRIDGATRENAANAGHSPDLARDAAAVATELGRAWKRPDRSTAARESTKRPARSRPSHLVVAAMAAVLAIFAVHAAAEHGRR